MSAAKLNIKIDLGAIYRKVLTYTNNGTRVDLAGWTAHMDIKDRVGGTVLVELSTENSRIFLQAEMDSAGSSVGVISLEIPATVTQGLTNKTGFYDLLLIPPTGIDDAVRLVQGSVTFSAAVTPLA